MIDKKNLNHLLKEKALQAAGRWREREKARKQPGTIKAASEDEVKIAERRVENNFTRESRRPATRPELVRPLIFPERIIKGNDFKDFPPNELGRTAGKPVARIENIPGNGMQAEGFATGFLVSPHLLMTNNHVFPDKESAKNCAANFLYERTTEGVNSGFKFFIDPDKFFYTDAGMDFSLVYVEPVSMDNKFSLSGFGFTRMINTAGKILVGQPIQIIQHPGGGIKRYAFQNNTVVDILNMEWYLHYTTDTERGSSGSPCFNSAWELSALHHSGVPLVINNMIVNIHGQPWDEENQDDDEIQWIANEGISISAIVEHLKNVNMGVAAQQNLLDVLLRTTSDPLLTGSVAPTPTPTPEIKTNETLTSLNAEDMSDFTMNFNGPTNLFFGQMAANGVAMQKAAVAAQLNGNGTAAAKAFAEKKQNFDTDYDNRPGYDNSFLTGNPIAIPKVISSRLDEMFLSFSDNKPYVLKYHHYSLVMNKRRKLCMWSASNVDYNEDKKSARSRDEFGGEDWTVDPRIPSKYQLTDEQFYKPAKKVDRGHVVRREDNCWGDSELEIEFANADTYHWTNCTQQHQSFNRDAFGEHGLWGMLENRIQQQITSADGRTTIFAGPILDNTNDPVARIGGVDIKYPLKFWKIVCAVDDVEGLISYGFILDQTDVVNAQGLQIEERLNFSSFKAQQATITAITSLAGVEFDQVVYDTDVLKNSDVGPEGLRPFRNANEIMYRRRRALTEYAHN